MKIRTKVYFLAFFDKKEVYLFDNLAKITAKIFDSGYLIIRDNKNNLLLSIKNTQTDYYKLYNGDNIEIYKNPNLIEVIKILRKKVQENVPN